jgi:BASS family bile acid:Na+ symporter
VTDFITTLLKALAWSATFAAMFAGALRLGPGCLRQVHERAGLFLRTMLGVWILVPVFTIAMVLAFGVRGPSATMLLLMAVCPGLPTLVANAKSARASATTALLALLLTAATEPLLIPYWTRILSTFHYLDLRVRAWHVIDVLLPTVFLPIVTGFVLRRLWPRRAPVLARLGDVVYWTGLTVGAIVAFFQGWPLLRHVPARAYVAALIITVGDALIGFWVARPDPEDQKAVALATALGNPALALAVVEANYPEHTASALVAAYLMIRGAAITPFEWWLARWRGGKSARRFVRRQERHA